jgi:CheY-like chemotaxis protein
VPRILVVDDDPDILKLVVRRLQHAQRRVLCAGSRAQAVLPTRVSS